jgi:hypothetical protein
MDCSIAAASLMSLPIKEAFNDIRSALTNANNDFARIATIARMGMGAARVWQQRNLFVQLEQLAKNARWWTQLNLLKISFDEVRFRGESEYRRSLVRPLLDKTSLDITSVLEYAYDYDIEGKKFLVALIAIHVRGFCVFGIHTSGPIGAYGCFETNIGIG